MKYYFKRHKMITEVIEIEACDEEDAYLTFETSPARGKVVDRKTVNSSHAGDLEISFWNPSFPKWKLMNS